LATDALPSLLFRPNAARTMSALREMGYDSFASIMDLIDNSIDAVRRL
jgi:hypothetical protein